MFPHIAKLLVVIIRIFNNSVNLYLITMFQWGLFFAKYSRYKNGCMWMILQNPLKNLNLIQLL